MTKPRQKILVICMLDSIHTARWLSIFKNQELDFYLFPSTPNRKIHDQLKYLISSSNESSASFRLANLTVKLSIPIWILGFFTKLAIPGYLINRVIKNESIDQIHAIELNHAGYLVVKAFKLGFPKKVKVIVTNWGSDIYWFQQFPKHLVKIKEVLKITDFYSAECERDVELAYKYGYQGSVNEVLPNTGGFELNQIMQRSKPPSQRKAIVIKGYESFVGRASIALAAIDELSSLLDNFVIHVISANRKTKKIASKLSKGRNLQFKIYAKKSLSHSQVLELFRESRVYIGASLSDAISTSLLEAMVSGTYPIQTETSCANEWIVNGKSGAIVKPIVEQIVNQLQIALKDDALVDNAALMNHETALNRLNSEQINKKLENFYLI